MLKELYGDSKIAKKCIFQKAWRLVKYLKIKFSDALLIVWNEVKRIFKNPMYIKLKLYIQGKTIKVYTDLGNSISDCLEIIGYTLTNKTLFFNISKNIYNNMSNKIDLIARNKSVTFHQDIYVTV
jgi:hypothetical protein